MTFKGVLRHALARREISAEGSVIDRRGSRAAVRPQCRITPYCVKTSRPTTNTTLISGLSFCAGYAREIAPRGSCTPIGRYFYISSHSRYRKFGLDQGTGHLASIRSQKSQRINDGTG